MKNRTFKILSLGAFGAVMLLAGAFLVSTVGAQVATQTPNCNVGSQSFWGYVACWIGSPSQGITGADTLFKGQKVLSDKIAAIPGGGGGGGGGNPQVYIERKNANGNLESIRLGQIFQGELKGNIWGHSKLVGYPPRPDPRCNSGPQGVNLGSRLCPQVSLVGDSDDLTVLFIPSPEWASANSNVFPTVDTERIDPTICFVNQNMTTKKGEKNVQGVSIVCSFAPNAQNLKTASGPYQSKDQTALEVVKYDYGINTTTPFAQAFRIRIK